MPVESYDHIRAEILLSAAEPIAHHAQVFGNTAVIMRRKIRLADGKLTEIPIVTGDTMRHGLREAAAYALLSAAGLNTGTLTEAALRFLFAGGVIGGSGSGLNLQEYDRLCDALPHLPLFGGCVGNRQIPGQLKVNDAVLCCEETLPTLPGWVRAALDEQRVDPARAHVELVQRVRMDPSLSPEKRGLLAPSEAAKIQQRLLASEHASATEDASLAEASKSTMMPRSFETVVSGSLFFWSVEVRLYSPLQRDTFFVAVRSFMENAMVGGKRGTGHGRLKPVAAQGVILMPMASRPMEEGLLAPDEAIGQLYRRHVGERSELVRKMLAEIVA